jgi:hypothetical protein
MKTRSALSRHENVLFHFLGTNEDSFLSGTVLVRPGDMVLQIPGGDGPYHLVGKARKHWFEGTNSDPNRRYEVDAKWAELGALYVGMWIEEGYEYLFSFDL